MAQPDPAPNFVIPWALDQVNCYPGKQFLQFAWALGKSRPVELG